MPQPSINSSPSRIIRARVAFGNHTFVNPYLPYGYRWWAEKNAIIDYGNAIIPGVRGAHGGQWIENGRPWCGNDLNGVMVLSQSTDFYVHPNGRDDADGRGDFMGGQPLSSYPQFAWASINHAAEVLARINANGHRVRLFISDNTWVWGSKGGGSYCVYWRRPRNCDRFEIIGNPSNPANCVIFRNTSEWGYGWVYGNDQHATDYDHENGELHNVDNIEGFHFKTVAPNDWNVAHMWWDTGSKGFRNCLFDNSYSNATSNWGSSPSWTQFRATNTIVGSSFGQVCSMYYFSEGPTDYNNATINVSVNVGDGATSFAGNGTPGTPIQANANTVFQNQSNWHGKSVGVSNFVKFTKAGKTWPGNGTITVQNSLYDGTWYTNYSGT